MVATWRSSGGLEREREMSLSASVQTSRQAASIVWNSLTKKALLQCFEPSYSRTRTATCDTNVVFVNRHVHAYTLKFSRAAISPFRLGSTASRVGMSLLCFFLTYYAFEHFPNFLPIMRKRLPIMLKKLPFTLLFYNFFSKMQLNTAHN